MGPALFGNGEGNTGRGSVYGGFRVGLFCADVSSKGDCFVFARRKAAVVGLVAAAVLGQATPALAEGGFDTYFSWVGTWYDSRNWDDHNNDSAATSVMLKDCDINWGWQKVEVQLRRNRTGLPDDNKGTRTYRDCNNGRSQWNNWGDVQRGTYHFTFSKINNVSDTLSRIRFNTCHQAGCAKARY